MKNITLHLICLVRRPSRARFFLAGIGREIALITFRAEILAFRVAYSTLG